MEQALSCYVKPRAKPALPVDRVALEQQQLWLEQSAPEAEAGIATGDGEWQLVLISLSNADRAAAELERFRQLGYAVNIKSVVRQGRTLHRLLLPGFVSREAAIAAGGRVAAQLDIDDAWVWRTD